MRERWSVSVAERVSERAELTMLCLNLCGWARSHGQCCGSDSWNVQINGWSGNGLLFVSGVSNSIDPVRISRPLKQAQAGNRFTHTTLSHYYSIIITAVIITIVISITLLFFFILKAWSGRRWSKVCTFFGAPDSNFFLITRAITCDSAVGRLWRVPVSGATFRLNFTFARKKISSLNTGYCAGLIVGSLSLR